MNRSLLGKITQSNVFLIDGLGASVTAFFLTLLARFESLFGIPGQPLHLLAVIAAIFSIYSWVCHLSKPRNWRLLLRIIAVANLTYCCLTVILIGYYYQSITILGLLYFLGEMLVIALLVNRELSLAKQ